MNQKYDALIEEIADYVCQPPPFSDEAYQTARVCLADALGCAILSLKFPECSKLLGPIIPGTTIANGCPIPGTSYLLDPINAAFNIGTMIRWLDYNDTWLAAEWGHPSDNLGCLLALGDYISRRGNVLTIGQLLELMIQAYEIQGIIALRNSYNKIGLDHVILVKIASAAIGTKMLGGNREQILSAISNAFIDLGSLRTYRHAPNTGSRKSWAAGDATSRAVFLSFMAMRGEMGYPHALSANKWGLYDRLFHGNKFTLARPFGCYVMENILFKVAFPAEFHAQTAVEAAIQLHSLIKNKLDSIVSIEIMTQEPAMRIIDKSGPLTNPAARDHCLQYMVAVGLLYGALTSEHYHDPLAQEPRIEMLRSKMIVKENPLYTIDYYDPDKRAIGNAITIIMKDGSTIGPLQVDYPLGHHMRRKEGIPLVMQKFYNNASTRFSTKAVEKLHQLFQDHSQLVSYSIPRLLELFQE